MTNDYIDGLHPEVNFPAHSPRSKRGSCSHLCPFFNSRRELEALTRQEHMCISSSLAPCTTLNTQVQGKKLGYGNLGHALPCRSMWMPSSNHFKLQLHTRSWNCSPYRKPFSMQDEFPLRQIHTWSTSLALCKKNNISPIVASYIQHLVSMTQHKQHTLATLWNPLLAFSH